MLYFCLMKKILLLLLLLPVVSSAQWEYRGTIGKDLKIWMRLETYADTAFGAYFYANHGKEIKLYGNGNYDKGYSLKEVNEDGKVTAILTLKKTARYDTYEGTWKPVNNKKKPLPIKIVILPPNVSLAGSPPEAIYFQKDSIVKKQKTKIDSFDIVARYPQFTFEDGYGRAQFNALMASFAHDEVQQWVKRFQQAETESQKYGDGAYSDYDMDYIITDTLGYISVVFERYFHESGTAHHNWEVMTRTYSGRLHRWVDLGDLFRPSSNYVGVLSRKCEDTIIHELRERARADYRENHDTADMKRKLAEIDTLYSESIERGAGPRKDNFRNFATSKDGIHIYFAPYEVAGYAEGSFDIFIPFSELEQILATDWEVRRWKQY